MIGFVICLNFILNSLYCFLIALEDDQSSLTLPLEIILQQYQPDTFFAYGVWTQYAPLSGFGEIGIFNSNCFNIHNAVDAQTNEVYFLYYDCIDQQNNAITKIIRFIDNTGNIQKFEITIENTQYEFQWFYFQIKQWPIKQKLDLCIVYGKVYLLHEVLEIQYPYYSNNVLITFGGDLIIQGAKLLDTLNQVTFSLFPGIFYIYPIEIMDYVENDPLQVLQVIFDSFSSQQICKCQQNDDNLISVELSQLDLIEYKSNTRYCDQYTVNGWIKIINITQLNESFTFLFLKMCANSENIIIIDQNLCSFQLFLDISNNINKIRVTTYSYYIPQINQDFTQNQNLISYEFEIHDIKSWISLQVIFIQNDYTILIHYYDNSQLIQQKLQRKVNHYHLVQFKFQFGNIFQLKQDFMTIKIYNFKFTNCQGYFIDNFCDISCKTCDGPTEKNCLSCDITQNRFFLQETKACICPYGYIDNQSCLNYQDYNFEINSNILDFTKKCEYGYFHINNNCMKCPSVIQSHKITCLECVENPQNWIQKPYCKYYIAFDDTGSPFSIVDEEQIYYYIFDGENLNFCENCSLNESQIDNHENFMLNSRNFQNFCQYSSTEESRLQFSENECYKCSSIKFCMKCKITMNGLYCLQCEYLTILVDGYCTLNQSIGYIEQQECLQPYYVTSNYGCNVCSIKNCIYCFEYLSNDLMFSTLYNDFTAFDKDEYHSVGCALCIPQYIFDFTNGECIKQKSSIENCSRSFINLNGIEVCTLSTIQDFTIAPEIEFCQQKIQKCQQCIQTPKKQIQCIICEVGYSASIRTGKCELCLIQNAKICIEGNFKKLDAWVQQIQSFMMQFLPNQYFYPTSFHSYFISQFPISCYEGYKNTFDGACILDCDSNCQKCEQTKPQAQISSCEYCGQNYYNQPIRSSQNGVCYTCPQLCEICMPRTQDEIKSRNPYFIMTDENKIFTYKCLKSVSKQQITIDPYLQISKICYEDNCGSYLDYNIKIREKNFSDVQLPDLWYFNEKQINYFYCNQMGILKLQINIIFDFISQPFKDWQMEPINILNTIKQKIFSLQELLFSMHGKQNDVNIFHNSLTLVNFDGIKFNRLNFSSILNNLTLSFINEQNYLTSLEFNDIVFYGFQDEQVFQINTFKLKIKSFSVFNLRIFNMIIKDSIIFFLDADKIQINSMEISNCIFYNVTLFQLINFSSIKINSFNILNSTIKNSNIYVINRFEKSTSTFSLDEVKIQDNYFINSSIFRDFGDFYFQIPTIFIFNQIITHNHFISSHLFIINKNLTIYNLTLHVNEFINSIFLKTFNVQSEDSLIFVVQNIFGFQNIFSNSIFILSINDSKFILNIKNFNFTESKSTLNQQEFLFQIKCISIIVQDFFMFENFNLKVFNLFQTQKATFNNIIFENSDLLNKIYFSEDCYPFNDYSLKFLLITGFTDLKLYNIKIVKQFNFDTSLILILSDFIFNQEDQEKIRIQNITVSNCILLKKNLGNLLSLIVIFSEKNQLIYLQNLIFNENTFHQYIDDFSQSFAGLIYIGSLQSDIFIESIFCDSNHITNTTHSFITIQSLTVFIQDFQVQNQNYLYDPSWSSIYFLQSDGYDQFDEYHMIGSIFKIENIGGAYSIASKNFTLRNGKFTNITAYSSAVIDIKTQGDGVVILKQIVFENISADLSQSIDLNGCINIYSKNSLLNLELKSIIFNSVFNNLGSSILSIIPSQKKNVIIFHDIELENCLSLANSLTKIDFPENRYIINSVEISNLSIRNTNNGIINFFQKLRNSVFSEFNKIKNDNAVINLKNCKLVLKNIHVQGITLQPILLLSDISQLILNQVIFISIQQFYRFNLVQISQYKQTIISSLFQKFTIHNTTQITLDATFNFNQNQRKFGLPMNQCHTNFSVLSSINYNLTFIRSYVEQLNYNQTTTFYLFQFYSDSDLLKIFFQDITLTLNECIKNQQNGIQIVLRKLKILRVNELKCFQNIFFTYGCLSVLNLNIQYQQPEILVQSSRFYANIGGQGVGIFSSNVNLKLLNCNIFQNNSTNYGGAIYFESQNEEIKIINSLIHSNQAKIGGGIYFTGNNHFTDKNFIKSMLQFNSASSYANNIKEYPRSLSLSINNKEMNYEQITKHNQSIQQLLIKPYKTLQQGKKIKTAILLFPSGQEIQKYQIFNFHKQKFTQYFWELSLTFKNSYGELMTQSSNIKCSIQQNIISDNKFKKISYYENLDIDNTTDKINLESFSFKFDPFSPQDTYSQLQIKCVTDDNRSQLIYRIKSKSLLCQLGEFYVDEACQICESNQGYYSVNYNVTKCSIFDKIKFKTITSNRIELLPGFWRPNQLSDQTELCFKNIQVCQGGWGTGDLLCSFGHIGGLCEECDIYNIKGEGFHFRNQYDNQCNFCFEFYSSIFPFFLSLLWSFLSIILTLRSVEKSNKLYTSLRLRQKYYKILFPLNQDHESILLKMLINYVWIFSAILTFNINFQISFNIAASTANPIQFMTTNLDCYLTNMFDISIIYSKLIFMIILICIEIIVITNFYFIIIQISRKKFDNSIISTTAIYLYVSNHASLIKHFCSLLTKRRISGIDYIQGDVSYLFDSTNHTKWILWFIQPGLGVFGFLIPLILFLLIFIQRKKLDQIKRRKYICYLFNEYNQNSYFWEQIKIWEKTIIIVILTYFETENLLKVSLLGICLLFYQKLAAKFQPYHIKILNRIDIDSGQICIFAIFLAAFTSGIDQESAEFQYTLQILLMILFIKLCIPFLYAALRVYYKKYKILIISWVIEIFKKLRIQFLFLNQKLNQWESQEHQLRNNFQKLRHCLTQISKVTMESQKNFTQQLSPTSRTQSQRNKFINIVYYSQNLF